MRFLSLQLSAVLLFALFIYGCPSSTRLTPPAPTGAISGTVFVDALALTVAKSRSATPISGALIRVQGTELATNSDANGVFSITNIPVGPQTIIISASGYQSISIPVTIVKDSVLPISSAALSPATRKWTVLVYMNADNNLEPFGVEDVNEMESVADSSQVNIAVMMDRTPGYDSSNGDWTGTKRFLIRHDTDTSLMTSSTNSPILEDLGEVDMGLPVTLREFISWGKSNFPAERYALIIWNHGSGWRSQAVVSSITRGVSFDDTSGNHISTQALPTALQSSVPLDVLSFDASLMQMLEIAYQIRKNCDIVVGSEESPPGAGYPYQRWLAPLVANPAMSPAELVTVMTRETLNYYGTSSNITQSAISMAKMPQLISALNDFSAQLIKVAGSKTTALTSARDESEGFGTSYYSDYKDLLHYAQLVKAKVNVSAVKNSADALINAINASMIAEYHGDFHPNSHGVSIFIPTKSSYLRLKTNYDQLDLAKNSQWDNWLAAQRE